MRTVYKSDPIQATSSHLARAISSQLTAGKKVLWLLSGGSGLEACVETAILLGTTDCRNLSVTLTDERYGPIDHPDENWRQLLSSGNFDLPGATLYRPLTGQSRQDTAAAFDAWLSQALRQSDFKIGLFGIGADGHTAGIKPGSPAVTSSQSAIDYSGEDYERITMTTTAISQLDEIVIQASGEGKTAALSDFINKALSVRFQPAQTLKENPNCTLYTNNQAFIDYTYA